MCPTACFIACRLAWVDDKPYRLIMATNLWDQAWQENNAELSEVNTEQWSTIKLFVYWSKLDLAEILQRIGRFTPAAINKKLIGRWDSERELSLRRHRTRTTKYNRLVHKFRHRSTRLCVGTHVHQIKWTNSVYRPLRCSMLSISKLWQIIGRIFAS